MLRTLWVWMKVEKCMPSLQSDDALKIATCIP